MSFMLFLMDLIGNFVLLVIFLLSFKRTPSKNIQLPNADSSNTFPIFTCKCKINVEISYSYMLQNFLSQLLQQL